MASGDQRQRAQRKPVVHCRIIGIVDRSCVTYCYAGDAIIVQLCQGAVRCISAVHDFPLHCDTKVLSRFSPRLLSHDGSEDGITILSPSFNTPNPTTGDPQTHALVTHQPAQVGDAKIANFCHAHKQAGTNADGTLTNA